MTRDRFPPILDGVAALRSGHDAGLLSAVARAGDPAAMAEGFARALAAGRLAHAAGPMEPRDRTAPFAPVTEKAWLA